MPDDEEATLPEGVTPKHVAIDWEETLAPATDLGAMSVGKIKLIKRQAFGFLNDVHFRLRVLLDMRRPDLLI